MKVKIAFDWDRTTQRELGVELDIPEDIVRSIIIGYLMQLNYKDRQSWVHDFLDDDNVKHISEDEIEFGPGQTQDIYYNKY